MTTVDSLIQSARAAEHRGDWDEAVAGYRQALALPEAAPADRARLLRWLGRVHFERGYYDDAAELFSSSLATAEAHDCRAELAGALNALALVAQFRGRVDDAEPLYARASTIAEEVGDEQLGAMIEQNRGVLANVRGDLTRAIFHYQSALDRFRQIGDELSAARILNNMGMLHVDAGEWGPAEMCYMAAFELAERLDDLDLRAKIQVNRTELALSRKQLDRARGCVQDAFRFFSRMGSETGLAETYKFMAAIHRETGSLALAETHALLALRLAQTCGDRLIEAEVEVEMGRVHEANRRFQDTLQALGRAYRVFRELEARREAVQMERRMEQVEREYLRAVRAWELSGPAEVPTAGSDHFERVAALACTLGEALGLRGRELTWLRVATLLYDLGKASIPASVLEKREPLTEAEWQLIRRHPERSAEMLAALDPPWELEPMVKHHHEHWDGSGYPEGLAGEEIPLGARIIGLSDAYAALTSDRSYRPAFGHGEALALMEQDAGRVFDPRLFRTFKNVVEGAATNGRARAFATN